MDDEIKCRSDKNVDNLRVSSEADQRPNETLTTISTHAIMKIMIMVVMS